MAGRSVRPGRPQPHQAHPTQVIYNACSLLGRIYSHFAAAISTGRSSASCFGLFGPIELFWQLIELFELIELIEIFQLFELLQS